jgi:hypothetical protein
VSAATVDQVTRRQLLVVLETAEDAANLCCGFWGCPGPDKRYVPMATCHVCRTVQLLRRPIRRLGFDLPAGNTSPRGAE